jgi:hypothetical protein
VSSQPHSAATLYPRGKEPWYPLYRRLGGPQSRLDTQKLKVKSFTSAGNRIPDVQSVVRHYNDCATTASKIIINLFVTIIIIIIIIIAIILQVIN